MKPIDQGFTNTGYQYGTDILPRVDYNYYWNPDYQETYKPLCEFYLPEGYTSPKAYSSDTFGLSYTDGYGYNFYYKGYGYYAYSLMPQCVDYGEDQWLNEDEKAWLMTTVGSSVAGVLCLCYCIFLYQKRKEEKEIELCLANEQADLKYNPENMIDY